MQTTIQIKKSWIEQKLLHFSDHPAIGYIHMYNTFIYDVNVNTCQCSIDRKK